MIITLPSVRIVAAIATVYFVGGNTYLHATHTVTTSPLSSQQKQSSLFLALISGSNKRQIKKVLTSQNVNLPDQDGITPLHFATANYPIGIAKLFIDAGAIIDARDNKQRTPLYYAAANGRVKFVRLFLRHGANVNTEDIDQSTPLHIAAANGHVKVMKQLLKYKATVNARNNDQETPLHYAAILGKRKPVELLLNHNAMINAKGGKNSETSLDLAIKFGNPALVKLLLRRNAMLDPHALQKAKNLKRMWIEKEAGNEEAKKKIDAFNVIIQLLQKSGNTGKK